MFDDDPSQACARLCADFHDLRLAANRHGREQRWSDLVSQSRGGAPDIAAWQAFRAELERLDAADDDFTLRGNGEDGLHPNGFPDWDDSAGDEEFHCPKHRCTRVERSLFGETPRCDLLGLDMTGRSSDRDGDWSA